MSAATTASEQRKRVVGKPFQKGQSGNPKGRPKGARQKLDECFVSALYKDFKEHGTEAVVRCREEKPEVYLNVIAKIVPKQVDVTADQSLADFADGLSAVAQFLAGFAEEAGERGAEGHVPGGPVLPPGARAQAH